ncbi:MAG: DNA-directed DNA polymerase I [Candidatus Asgardarchaeum sp.]
MSQSTLDFFFNIKEKVEEKKEKKYEEIGEIKENAVSLEIRRSTPKDVLNCILLDVGYDGKKEKAFVKLYDPIRNRIYFWYDNTDHHPYCLTDIPKEELEKNKRIVGHPSFLKIEEIEKIDLLHDGKIIRMSKICARDPLAIGGSSNSIRNMLPSAWEAHIPYRKCYIMDAGIIPGMIYSIKDGDLVLEKPNIPRVTINELYSALKDDINLYEDILQDFLPLFFTPIPKIKRVAMDIEVESPQADVIPDSSEAAYHVIAVAFSSDDLNEVHILRRSNKENITWNLLGDVKIHLYDNEKDLISAVFKRLWEIPILVTFNGDNFDMLYLYNRGLRLGFSRNNIPITVGKDYTDLKNGIHIDLYPFFHNKSIQSYAFGNSYKETTLEAITQALLNKGKVPLNKPIPDLSEEELAYYCFTDAQITYELTSFNDDLVMKMIILMMRISKLPILDITRQSISAWIRNMIYFEHRKRNYLIPRPEDILKEKGQVSTKAIIKGKKYMGAIVVEPIEGVHFNVVVLDFASLYPSIIKRWNLSYETIRCPHEECKSNVIPETSHWVCKKRRGITSALVGFLRDIRVKWFKMKAKDPSISKDERSMYKVIQATLKVFINATYGVFGSEHFELYCPPVAESTTALGRFSIMKTKEKAEEMGIKVIYGDTDSVFLYNPTPEQVEHLKRWSINSLGIELDVDKVYRWVALSNRKKNYLGVLENGTIDVKGLLGKKRNTPEFAKKAFHEILQVLSKVNNMEDFELAKKKIIKIVQEAYRKLERGEVSLEDLAIKVQLTKPLKAYTKTTPQHVKAARLLEHKGKKVLVGQIISFVKTTTSPGVKPIELAKISEIDIQKYKEYLQSTFEQVLDALGIDIEQFEGITSLSSWF